MPQSEGNSRALVLTAFLKRGIDSSIDIWWVTNAVNEAKGGDRSGNVGFRETLKIANENNSPTF
jgi:hypothetical protein